MARVLILELDPVFAAVLEDRLLVAGHQPTLATDPAVAASAATEGQTDLLIMDLELPTVSGLEIVRQLRRQNETRSLPILALSESDASADRIAALRAGVDDFLTKPCDPEELMLRLDRLVGSRGVAAPVMQGDLSNHPIWELLQYIEQAGKTGDLVIHGNRGSGKVRLERGRVLSARWGKLRDRDALMAIADMKQGRFRLTTEKAGDEPAGSSVLHIAEVLIRAAWIEDQLAKRRVHLPATGAPLETATDTLPEIEEELHSMPIEEVFQQVARRKGVRIYDLISEADKAPPKIRLAVAWLVEQGAVAPVQEAEVDPMSTAEISSAMVLDAAVYDLLSKARAAGFDVSALPYLLLAESGVWPDLQQLPASVPGFLRIEELRELVESTQDGSGGSATFSSELGRLSLHVQPLTGAARQQVEAIVSVCAGVLLWLDEVEEPDLISRVIGRLEAASGAGVGVLVVSGPTARQAASELIADTTKWQVSTHAPQSLLGVFRLLQPRAA